MELGEIHKTVIQLGREHDPRGADTVALYLAEKKEAFKALKEKDRKNFDRELLENPYADTRILHGDPEKDVRKVMVGIDVGIGEVLLVDRLNEKGAGIDCIIPHHPTGKALRHLDEVMNMQVDIFHMLGIPVSVAEGLTSQRISEVERRILPQNTDRALDAAKHLDIPVMTVHTPADNMVTQYLSAKMKSASPRRLKHIIALLEEEEEYARAIKERRGLKVLVGNNENRAGEVFIDMTGGTSPAKEVYAKLASNSEVGTVVCMHMNDEYRKLMEESHINVLVAGHIASDSLGLNLLLDRTFPEGDVKILACSGFHRVRRG